MKKKFFLLLSILSSCVFCFSNQNDIKVYDCFPFFNELDVLEIRLNELYDAVDYFLNYPTAKAGRL